MPANMTTEEKIPFNVAYTTRSGSPAVVDGVPVATLSLDTIAHLDGPMAPDPAVPGGWTGMLVADGIGDEVVTVTADADMGAGVVPIILSDTATIQAAGAAAGVFGFGTPVPK